MSAPYIQANTHGRLHSATEPSLTPLNRGFLYGDAIYEVWRTYHGVIFAWEEHWARLQRSAEALDFVVPWSPEQMLAEIRRTVAAFREQTKASGELYIRLQISRGAGPIGLDPALADEAIFVLLVQPVPALSAAAWENGLSLTVARALRRNPVTALNPAWKTGNYLNNILCLREARGRGADEVVIENLQGELTEAAVSNLGFIDGDTIVTPPLDAGILAGITRHLVAAKIAATAGLLWAERPLRREDLPAFSECFLLSTTKDVQPVRAIDEHCFRVGPGTAGRRLKEAFAAFARQYAEQHPQWRA